MKNSSGKTLYPMLQAYRMCFCEMYVLIDSNALRRQNKLCLTVIDKDVNYTKMLEELRNDE